jgi:hypothetical protein
MRLIILMLSSLLPFAAAAETPMTAAEFDAFATNRTLNWSNEVEVFGVEEYLPGRRVRWAFVGDICRYGEWYQDGENICFLYDDDPEPKCWTIWGEGDTLSAIYRDDPTQSVKHVDEAKSPLLCRGPDVGV